MFINNGFTFLNQYGHYTDISPYNNKKMAISIKNGILELLMCMHKKKQMKLLCYLTLQALTPIILLI